MDRWVIICADGLPLADFDTGELALLPSVREAANWMIERDLRVERYDPAKHRKRKAARSRPAELQGGEDGT